MRTATLRVPILHELDEARSLRIMQALQHELQTRLGLRLAPQGTALVAQRARSWRAALGGAQFRIAREGHVPTLRAVINPNGFLLVYLALIAVAVAAAFAAGGEATQISAGIVLMLPFFGYEFLLRQVRTALDRAAGVR